MPSWIEVGVAMPFPGLVGVGVGVSEEGVAPRTPTQTYVFSQRLVQVLPMAGFQVVSRERVTE
jgi:hypothetical protein